MWFLKLVAAVALLGILAIAGLIYDTGWNDGRLMALLLGRDKLVAQCLPPLRAELAQRGFAPTDVEFAMPVSIGIASGSFGRIRVLTGAFTFSDGPNGARVDGRLVCRAEGTATKVEVEVDATPLRAA